MNQGPKQNSQVINQTSLAQSLMSYNIHGWISFTFFVPNARKDRDPMRSIKTAVLVDEEQ